MRPMRVVRTKARQIVVGLTAMAVTLIPVPVRAQILGGIVHDPINYALQVEKRVEEAARWVQTIDHYIRMYENAVRQLTTLTGVLKTAEQHLGFHKETLTTISSIGRTIRTSFRVKRLVEGLVVGQVRALKEIDDRLRNGIFDPEADRRDLEDYLRNGIGRTSQDALANMERLEKMDNTINRANYDIKRLSNNRAEAEDHIKQMQEQLEALKNCEECTEKDREIQALSVQIFQASQQQEQTNAQIEQLRQEILKRTEAIAEREEARLRFASQVTTLKDGWKKLGEAKQRVWEKLRNND
jgi:predicted  nucleic acid-binding Zn-ribbon protein